MVRDPLSAQAWWGRVNACRRVRKEKLKVWQDSVSYRRGKPFKSTPPEDTVNVPADWSKTKAKISQLFYQVPEVILQPRHPKWGPSAPVFAAALNFELSERMHVEYTMHECLADVINAAGIMIAMTSFEGSFEDVPMGGAQGESGDQADVSADATGNMSQSLGGQAPGSEVPDDQAPNEQPGGAMLMGNSPQPVTPSAPGQAGPGQDLYPRTVYQCYKTDRVSPAHFLWPLEFVGSDWRKAYWLGREGYKCVADAVREGWVPEGTEGVQIADSEWLLINEYMDIKPADSYVKYVEIFYFPYYLDSTETDPFKIKRVVLIEDKRGEQGKVVDEDFRWQKKGPAGKWVGMTTLPLTVGTITHVSDMAIPPSDSEIGRPQVRELIKSRTQMVRQRDHSQPIRWFDVNLVDPAIGNKLRNGKWQDIIPMNGPGDHAIGEVARAQFPPENWNFDRVIKADLDEAWSMGAMQQGVTQPGDTTATEVREISQANDTRLALEQQWTMRFFLQIAQNVGGLMQLFQDDQEYVLVVGEDGQQALQAWNKDSVPGEYLFKFKPDSQLKLDVSQRRLEGLNLYKLLRKDPMVNPAVLIRRVLEDHGLPITGMQPPPPPKKDVAKLAASFKGDDLANPIAIAFINKNSDSPLTAQDIAVAQQLIDSVRGPIAPPAGALGALGMPGGGPIPGGAPSGPVTVNAPHPGPTEQVLPLDRRYAAGGNHGAEGSRDSALPVVKS